MALNPKLKPNNPGAGEIDGDEHIKNNLEEKTDRKVGSIEKFLLFRKEEVKILPAFHYTILRWGKFYLSATFPYSVTPWYNA